MGRNEIRFRKHLMNSGRIARHRNYSELMRQHDRDTRMKRIFRAFTYFLVILFLLIILIIVMRWEKKATSMVTPSHSIALLTLSVHTNKTTHLTRATFS